jgi:hypothetical protein
MTHATERAVVEEALRILGARTESSAARVTSP